MTYMEGHIGPILEFKWHLSSWIESEIKYRRSNTNLCFIRVEIFDEFFLYQSQKKNVKKNYPR